MQAELSAEKSKMKQLWRRSCQQLADHEAVVASKEAEVSTLRAELQRIRMQSPTEGAPTDRDVDQEWIDHTGRHPSQTLPVIRDEEVALLETHGSGLGAGRRHTVVAESTTGAQDSTQRRRRGRAPPVDPFTGDDPEIRLEDWLPTLQRVSAWNGWSEDELLMQLAGHLRGRALKEWNLVNEEDRKTWERAVDALHCRLDSGSRTMAAQDFRHTHQKDTETVADFIRRLERTFRIAYGGDAMSLETREAILHSQLQEGLRYNLMEAPAVSGAQAYQQLCLAAKNEETRQAGLKKRQQYQKARFPSGETMERRKPQFSQASQYGVAKWNP